jgi:hypothetical protein
VSLTTEPFCNFSKKNKLNRLPASNPTSEFVPSDSKTHRFSTSVICSTGLISTPSGLNYKQKSSKKFILKYKQKSTNSTLFNTFIPKMPFLSNSTTNIYFTPNNHFIGPHEFQEKIPHATLLVFHRISSSCTNYNYISSSSCNCYYTQHHFFFC